jgi:DNA-binding XRE family transcriptional regulator
MGKAKSVAWSDVRAKRPVDEAVVAEHAERMEAGERAHRLREIRGELGVTQKEFAERMGLTQPMISALESGELERSGLATSRSYVEALGGTVEVIATFGDRKLVLSRNAWPRPVSEGAAPPVVGAVELPFGQRVSVPVATWPAGGSSDVSPPALGAAAMTPRTGSA